MACFPRPSSRRSESPVMKTSWMLLFLPTLLLVFSRSLPAQQPAEPKPLRFDVSLFIGERTSMTFPVDPHVTGTNPRVVLEASPSYGIAFGGRPREEDLIEVRWARQDSYVHSEEITTPIQRQRVVLDQFHGDFSHEPWIEQWPVWIRPYVLASVGGTRIFNSAGVSFTRFSFGLGAGIRFYATRHVGFKLQGEWLPVLASPQVAFVCGGGCIIHVGGAAASQAEIFASTFLRF